MYKSLAKTTKKYPELEAHEILKRVASANAIIKHYKSFSLITVKRHAMVLSFLRANLVYFNLMSMVTAMQIQYRLSVLTSDIARTCIET